MSIFAFCSLFCNFSRNYYYRERTRKTRNTRKPYITFRSLSLFRICFAILYFIAKGRGIRGIREKHISLFAAFRSFAFFRNSIFYRERTRKMRNTRKTYITFRSLSLFRIFRNPIFYRERTRNTRKTRKPYITFRNLSCFRIFSQSYIYRERTRKMRNTRKHIYFSNHFRLFALFRNRNYSRRLLLRTRTGSMNNSLKLTSSPSL